MKTGMLGGTFDPVHLGHLIGAQCAVEQLELDRLLFVPAAHPPHKLKMAITPARHRVAMLRRAITGNPSFALWLDEIRRGGSSYTVDTVRRYREKELQKSDELFFILGADNLADLNTWKSWRELCREVRIAALARKGFSAGEKPLDQDLEDLGVLRVRMPIVEISATDIRNRCRLGESIRYLVPDPVAEYIETHELYRGPEVDFKRRSG